MLSLVYLVLVSRVGVLGGDLLESEVAMGAEKEREEKQGYGKEEQMKRKEVERKTKRKESVSEKPMR